MSAPNQEILSNQSPVKGFSQFASGQIYDHPDRDIRDSRAVTSSALIVSPQSLSQQLVSAIEQGRNARQLKADTTANDFWDNSYPTLMDNKPWLFQVGVDAAKRQVLRLAHPLAVEAQSNMIRSEHLQAAMVVWEFADKHDRLPRGPLTFDKDEHVVFFRNDLCQLRQPNSRRIFTILYRAYQQMSFVHHDVMVGAFDDIDISNNGIAQGVTRLKKELRRDGLLVVADAIEAYKWAVPGSYRIRSETIHCEKS